VRRRTVITGLAVAATIPRSWAQQPLVPVVGYLSGRSRDTDEALVAAFREGLADGGYLEGRNVAIEYVSADGHAERLSGLAGELVGRQVAVIFASSSNSAVAAKAATATVPIVFTGASDPVRLGLAASLSRPGGNLTGVTMFAHAFSAKRLELLHQLLPEARSVGILANPANPSAETELHDLQTAAPTFGLQTMLVEARAEGDIDAAFATLAGRDVGMLYVVDDPLFTGRRKQIGALAKRHSIAAISTLRELAEAGALASYGASFAAVHRECGVYVARILKGENPGDLPIMLPTRFTLVVNLKTAQALGSTVPASLLALADEVIE
jgi:putative ABC transport system substrate-binding protein